MHAQRTAKRCRLDTETRCVMPYLPVMKHTQDGSSPPPTIGRATQPALVSALCVTGRHRSHQLMGSIADWHAQMYAALELVIVFDTWDTESAAVAKRAKVWGEQQMRRSESAGSMVGRSGYVRRVTLVSNADQAATLGHRRNMAVRAAHGHYVTQWDDDDMYDSRRVHEMVLALENAANKEGKRAVILDKWTILDLVSNAAYITGTSGVANKPKEGSILAERSLLLAMPYPQEFVNGTVNNEDGTGPCRAFGGDMVLVNSIISLTHLMSAPHLYTYVVHGDNKCNRKHFKQFRSPASRPGGQHAEWTLLPRSEVARLRRRLMLRHHDAFQGLAGTTRLRFLNSIALHDPARLYTTVIPCRDRKLRMNTRHLPNCTIMTRQ